ncbi:ABC transporter ATP-binding protein [Aquabacter sp. CN5-332]|uniref:ABC transporter ATP-binding protein n=1 Tax=Aquabacter sp. CN5-332 TaxID=3156608 RepID=UPI0032B41AA6
MSNPGILLSLIDVTRTFGGVQALSNVSLDVHAGGITGIIGPNGAGKTTTFNIITGAYEPTAGEIYLSGQRMTGLRPYQIARAGIARTFQNIRLFSSMTVWEHLLVAQRPKGAALSRFLPAGLSKTQAAVEAERALTFFGLEKFRDRPARSLPYGLQRKVEMARALTAKPHLLLLDEPIAGMNHEEAEELRLLLLKLCQDGLSILLIEHDMTFVMNLCERLYVLDFGRLIAKGTPDEVRTDPVVLDAYLGSEA